MSTTRFQIASGLLLAAVLLGGVGPTSGQPPGRGALRAEVRGLLKAVDAKARTITIATPDGRQAPTEKTYALAKDVEIALDSGTGRRGVFKEGKLADLTPETLVSLTLAADQKTVESIGAEGPMVRGIIKGTDLEKKTLTATLFVRREEPDEKTYTIAPNAEIALDDGLGRRFSFREGKLSDLAAGGMVTLRLSPDQKNILSLIAEGANISGTVKSVDAGKKTLTIAQPPGRGGEGGEEKTVQLAGDGAVLVDDGRGRRLSVKELKLADLPAGSAVNVRLSVDQKSAVLVRAEGPNIPALIKRVDVEKRTITVATRVARDQNPEEKTWPVAKDARIVVDGKDSKLADIMVADDGPFGMVRLSLDQKTVQGIMVGGRGR